MWLTFFISKPCMGSTWGHSPDLYVCPAANPQSAKSPTKIHIFEFILEYFQNTREFFKLDFNSDLVQLFSLTPKLGLFMINVNSKFSLWLSVKIHTFTSKEKYFYERRQRRKRNCKITELNRLAWITFGIRLVTFLSYNLNVFLCNCGLNAHSFTITENEESLWSSYSVILFVFMLFPLPNESSNRSNYEEFTISAVSLWWIFQLT